MKGHFAENWTYPNTSFPSWAAYYDPSYTGDKSMWGYYADALPVQSDSGSTIITSPANYRPEDKIDFQIEALLAYQETTKTYDGLYPITENIFYYNPSGWSNTQTITIPEGSTSTSASPNPTPTNTLASPTPTVPEFLSWTIPLLGIVLATAGLMVYFRKSPQEHEQA